MDVRRRLADMSDEEYSRLCSVELAAMGKLLLRPPSPRPLPDVTVGEQREQEVLRWAAVDNGWHRCGSLLTLEEAEWCDELTCRNRHGHATWSYVPPCCCCWSCALFLGGRALYRRWQRWLLANL